MEDWKDWKTRKFWIGLLVLALVTAALEHLLALSASGALRAWGRLLEIASFGSQRLRDAPFESAALNPYPLPSLIVFEWVAVGIATTGVIVAFQILAMYRRFRRRRANREVAPVEHESHQASDRKLTWAYRIVLPYLALSVLADPLVLVPIASVNEAILARRIYEADRDIVAPYLSPAELTNLQAQFAAIDTRAQYDAVMARIDAIAKTHQLKLHPFEP